MAGLGACRSSGPHNCTDRPLALLCPESLPPKLQTYSPAVRIACLSLPRMVHQSIDVLGIATELTILALIIYTPWGHLIFRTEALPLWIFGPLIMGSLFLLSSEELRKLVADRLHNNRSPAGPRSKKN